MNCSSCGAEYVEGVLLCPDCGVRLGDAAPVRWRALGRFDAIAAPAVIAELRTRGVDAEVDGDDEAGEATVRVPEESYADLRAALLFGWDRVLARLDLEEVAALTAGPAPGWRDAPQGAWVDRDGRVRVSEGPEAEEHADARRTIGPAMAAVGALLLLLAWYVGPGPLRGGCVVVGVTLLLVGLLLPR